MTKELKGARQDKRALIDKVLKERALLLQQSKSQDIDLGDSFNALVFCLGEELYAFDSEFITEVIDMPQITPLPCTPDFLLGIINVRGEILSVIDTKKYFKIFDQKKTDKNFIILVKYNGLALGFLADEIKGNRLIYNDQLQKKLENITEISDSFIKGVTKERIILMDLKAMLTNKSIIVNEEV